MNYVASCHWEIFTVVLQTKAVVSCYLGKQHTPTDHLPIFCNQSFSLSIWYMFCDWALISLTCQLAGGTVYPNTKDGWATSFWVEYGKTTHIWLTIIGSSLYPWWASDLTRVGYSLAGQTILWLLWGQQLNCACCFAVYLLFIFFRWGCFLFLLVSFFIILSICDWWCLW